MSQPVEVRIPHKLGQSVAKDRIGGGIGKLEEIIPGAQLSDLHWEGDVLVFTLTALGQRVAGRLDVQESHVHALLDLPPMLATFANKAKEMLERTGPKLLK